MRTAPTGSRSVPQARIDDAVSVIASSGLNGPRTDAVPFRPADATEWSALLGRIRFERVSGLAVEAAATGALDLAEDQADELLQLHRAGMTWCLHAERKLLRLADAFDDAGIEYAILKGPALAHTVYREPCLRAFGDLDLLVRSQDYNRASALLTRIGHARSRPEPRPGWEARFGKASVHVRSGRRDRDRSAPNARPRTVRSVDRRGRTDDEPGHLRCGWANAPTARRHRHVPERRVARSAWVGPSEDRSHPRLLRACGLSVT